MCLDRLSYRRKYYSINSSWYTRSRSSWLSKQRACIECFLIYSSFNFCYFSYLSSLNLEDAVLRASDFFYSRLAASTFFFFGFVCSFCFFMRVYASYFLNCLILCLIWFSKLFFKVTDSSMALFCWRTYAVSKSYLIGIFFLRLYFARF